MFASSFKSALSVSLALWGVLGSSSWSNLQVQAKKVQVTVDYSDSKCGSALALLGYTPVVLDEDATCKASTSFKGVYQTHFAVTDPFKDALTRLDGTAFVTLAKLRTKVSNGFEYLDVYLADGKCHAIMGTSSYLATISPTSATVTKYADTKCMQEQEKLVAVDAKTTRDGKQFTFEANFDQMFARVYDATGKLQSFGTLDTTGPYAQYFEFGSADAVSSSGSTGASTTPAVTTATVKKDSNKTIGSTSLDGGSATSAANSTTSEPSKTQPTAKDNTTAASSAPPNDKKTSSANSQVMALAAVVLVVANALVL